MSYHTESDPRSQDKWYYAYLVDDIPQQLPADNANGYTGPFDTEREAWLALYAEMTAQIKELQYTCRVVVNATKAIAEYTLPVAGGQS